MTGKIRIMKRRMQDLLDRCRCMDWAVLYLRLFAGAIMLFHNIGKVQLYDESIASYPSVFHVGPAAVFVCVTVVEVLLAVLLIVGLRVRIAALLLVAGILLRLVRGGLENSEEGFVWLGIYAFFLLSGGGTYAFDGAMSLRNGGKNEKIGHRKQ